MAATRLLRVKPLPYPGTFGPVFRKLGNAKNWGVLAKKNLTASELPLESRKSAFELNWSSWKVEGEEPENSPFACGVEQLPALHERLRIWDRFPRTFQVAGWPHRWLLSAPIRSTVGPASRGRKPADLRRGSSKDVLRSPASWPRQSCAPRHLRSRSQSSEGSPGRLRKSEPKCADHRAHRSVAR